MLKMLKTATISLALVLAISPASLALEPAEEFPANWSCDSGGRHDPDLNCYARCQYYDGTQERNQAQWHCPNSNFKTSCAHRPCHTQEQCDRIGFPYTPCHDVTYHVCKARAVRENDFVCKVRGPKGSAVKVGDCVLRVVFNEVVERMQVRMDCWNPSDYAFAYEGWEPVHPETLVRFPPPRPKR